MFNFILQHKRIAAVLTLLILGGVWYGLTSGAAPAPILQTETAGASDDQKLVSTLLMLHTVTLSGTIFTDPTFMSLQDFGVAITPEQVGRDNPFAPLTPEALPTTQTTRAANIFAPTTKK